MRGLGLKALKSRKPLMSELTVSGTVAIPATVSSGGLIPRTDRLTAPRKPGHSRRRAGALAALAYLACSLALFAPMLADPLHRALGGGSGDPAQMMWFLRWTPYAIVHGHNPFLSNAIDYPVGINLLWNTSMPLAGVVLAPVTLTLGPVFAFNLLVVLGPATTAWASRWWLAGHVSPAAAGLGGLLIGFSPFVVGQAQGHANLVVLPLVPVVLRLLEKALWRDEVPSRRTGVLLGLALAGQALLSEEVLLLLVIGVVAAVAAALVWGPAAQVWGAVRRALIPLGVAAATSLAVFGFPLGTELFGPHRVSQLSWRPWEAVPQDLVRPTDRMLLHGTGAGQLARNGVGNSFEIGSYLGIPLIILLVVIAVRMRQPAICIALSVAVLGILFSFGLDVRIPFTHLTLPGIPLLRLTAIKNMLPMRFALVTWVAVGWLVAQAVDRLRSVSEPRRRRTGLILIGLCLLPLVPATEPAGRQVRIPAFFTDGAAQSLPSQAPMLVLPTSSIGSRGVDALAGGCRDALHDGGRICTTPERQRASRFHADADTPCEGRSCGRSRGHGERVTGHGRPKRPCSRRD